MDFSNIMLLPHHVLCKACLIIVKRQSEAEKPTKAFGHRAVCLGCGASLLRERSKKLNENRPETHVIASGVPEIQTSHITQACFKCWRKASRHLLPKDEKLCAAPVVEKPCVLVKIERCSSPLNDDSQELPSVRIKEELELSLPENMPDEDGRILISPPTLPSVTPLLNPNPTDEREMLIRLPVYKRVPNTSSNCCSRQCFRSSLRTIPAGFKRKMLAQHKTYLTKNARICSEHLNERYNTDFMNTLCNNHMIHNFNAAQIQDMMAILTKHSMSQFNLEDVENMNDALRDFWLGVTPEQFYEIIEKSPSLQNMRNYKVNLALYLVKLRTGYTVTRICSNFGFSRNTLQNKLNSVRDCLKSDNVPLDLGVRCIVEKPVRCVIEENELMSEDDVIEENELVTDDNAI